MEISIKWFTESKYPSFNVMLASAPGRDPFLEIKGCRIVDGKNGEFVSWPSTKNESTGKYWNHCYGSEQFNEAVLEKAKAAKPVSASRQASKSATDDDFQDDIPF
jgi:DNA-binding cell septation regulator SpoVG